MSGHGDHSADKTQAERDLERKERDRLLTNLYEATLKLNPQTEAIPSIKALHSLYDLGLKEAKDVHDGIMQITGRYPYSNPGNEYRTWRVVRAIDHDNVSSAVADLKRERDAAEARLADAEREAEKCKSCGAYLDRERQPLGYCGTGCFQDAQERVEETIRLAELDRQIDLVRGDLAALEGERAELLSRRNPEANEDAINLDDDYQPF